MVIKEENMIKNVKIKGFQSHKDSFLEFDPGVNVITGSSDSGKTSIIRAVLWLIQNRPQGNAFCSNWADNTSIQLKIDNYIIKRFRNKNSNTYFLNDLEFKAIGTEVPKEISDILNLNEVNIACQLDSPFLLSDSPGEVAKHFNKVAHLDQIDSGLKNVQSWLKGIERDIIFKEDQLVELDKDLQKFAHLDKFEMEVEVLERLQTDMITKVNQVRKLEKLILDLTVVFDLIEEQNKITKAGPLVNKVLDWYLEKHQINEESEELKQLVREIYETEDALEEESQILSAEKSVKQLLSLFTEQTEKQNTCSVLHKLVERILYTTEEQITAENRSKRLQTEFNAVFPDVCPLCGKLK